MRQPEHERGEPLRLTPFLRPFSFRSPQPHPGLLLLPVRHALDAHGGVGGGDAGVARWVVPDAVDLGDVVRVLLAPARDLGSADGLERSAADGRAGWQCAFLEEVALLDAGDDSLEQGVKAVGLRDRGVALAEVISLEEERAEAHEHSVDDRVGAEVATAPVASQVERVERGVVQALRVEPGAHGSTITASPSSPETS